MPSSPQTLDKGHFSSDALQSESELSSLPSSPPRPPTPILKAHKPAFSVLKRKRSFQTSLVRPQPLLDIAPNAQKKPRQVKGKFTQMQIDLGGETRKTCKACGMEYIPSQEEDTALHRDFCSKNLRGFELGKGFVKDETINILQSETILVSEKEVVVMVDKRSSAAAKNKSQGVLAFVNAELGAADIDASQLWGDLSFDSEESRNDHKRRGFYGQEKKQDRYKAFLHIVEGRCIAFCLAEKISKAFPVVGIEGGSGSFETIDTSFKPSSVSHSNAANVVLLGISRIWTSRPHRLRGLAANLLNCATHNFFYGIQVPRHLLAFSQPTESGITLAEHWCQRKTGWHVYHPGIA